MNNDELEQRLRRFGDTVDSAAAEVEARRMPVTASDPAAAEPVPGVLRPEFGGRRRVRIVAVAAAVVLIAGGTAVTTHLLGSDRASPSAGTKVVAGPQDFTAPPTTVVSSPTPSAATVAADTSTSTSLGAPTSTSTSTSTTNEATPATAAPRATAVCPDGYRADNGDRLELCDSGERVRMVQQVVGVDVDGYFGPTTRSAVRAFQGAKGLAVDGFVGPATWSAMFPSVPYPGPVG